MHGGSVGCSAGAGVCRVVSRQVKGGIQVRAKRKQKGSRVLRIIGDGSFGR
jgi:hypothetical protein